MRTITTIVIFLLAFNLLNAQSTTDDVGVALKSSSTKELINYFNKITELKIEDKGGNYTKIQAESVIKDFFTKNPATNFTYIHKGSSPEGLKYNIGRYTSKDINYRVVMLLKKVNDTYVIDTINFNKE